MYSLPSALGKWDFLARRLVAHRHEAFIEAEVRQIDELVYANRPLPNGDRLSSSEWEALLDGLRLERRGH